MQSHFLRLLQDLLVAAVFNHAFDAPRAQVRLCPLLCGGRGAQRRQLLLRVHEGRCRHFLHGDIVAHVSQDADGHLTELRYFLELAELVVLYRGAWRARVLAPLDPGAEVAWRSSRLGPGSRVIRVHRGALLTEA